MDTTSDMMARRRFLGGLAAGATTMGLAMMPGAERLLADEGTGTAAIESTLKRLAGRSHKQVFDAPAPHDSLPVIWSWAYLFSHNGLGVEDDDVGAFVVLRHDAIPFAMEDGLWKKYKFGEKFHITDKVTNAPSTRNIVTNVKPQDMPLPDMALERVQSRGVVFGVCDLALTVNSGKFAQEMNMDPEQVKAEWVSGLLPGINLLPSGVWAVGRAQELGFTYCFAG